VKRIRLEEGISRLCSLLERKPSEKVPISAAIGMSLAEDVTAGWSLPRYDISHMDGYAVISEDLQSASDGGPVSLKIVGISRPDGLPSFMRSGECMRVLTGGRLPEGADAVVPQEQVKAKEGRASFGSPVQPFSDVHRAGSDVAKGDLLLTRGRLLGAREVSFLVALGVAEVVVCPKLRVGVLATGSELIETFAERTEGKINEGNRMIIMETLGKLGFETESLGIAADDPHQIAAAIRRGLKRCDAFVTTGGSSVGEADFVPEALKLLGGVEVFHGLLMRPSRTAGAFLLGTKPVFVLSGLIQASVSALLNLVYPSLEFMEGLGWRNLPTVTAFLGKEFTLKKSDPFKQVVWVRLRAVGGKLIAEPMIPASTSRHVITRTNGFFLAEGDGTRKEGDAVDVRLPYGFRLEDSLGGR
jgi:molybdopterin molybdotransferase